MANLLFTNVVVSILVSVYRHQQRADTPTVQFNTPYTLAMQATYDKHKPQNGPYSHNCSHSLTACIPIKA